MKALITGASGFIGSTLVEELNTLGFEVYALLRKTSSTSNLSGMKYERVEGSLSDRESLRKAVRGMDYVFHLAGTVAAGSRAEYFEHNAKGTERLAEAVAGAQPGLTRFVYVSSLAAGGPARSKFPRTESDPDAPVSAYGESKRAGELALLKYKERFPISIIRPPLVYGPKDKGVFVIIKTVARNLMPVIQGHGEGGNKFYSAIYSQDLCRGIVQAAVTPGEKIPSGEIFYLCGEGVYSYTDLLSTMAEKLDCDPVKIRVPEILVRVAARSLSVVGRLTRRSFPLNMDKLNEILPDYWICSNAKAKTLLGFSPEYDLATGMAKTVDWYRRNHWL